MKSIINALGASAAALLLSSCAMSALPPPAANFESIQAARTSNLPAMAIGDFTPGPGDPTAMDKRVTVRAGVQAAPGGSFAKYLGDTVAAQLKAAGKLDPASPLKLSAVVVDTHVDSALPKAHGSLAAHFTLTRDGKPVFDKVLSVESDWDSNLLGGIAIPDAFLHYNALFATLTTKLLSDPEFAAAARAN